jgi:hypothetical protein
MKKLFILSMFCISITMQLFSQGVTTVTSVLTGGTNSIANRPQANFGLTPSDSFLSCVVKGQAASDTIFFTAPSTVTVTGIGTVTLDSLYLDSIYLPNGLTWQTNSTNNGFTGGRSGVILVTGNTNDSAGQYLLRIIFTGVAFGQHQQANAALEGLYYSVRVRQPACSCTPYVRDTVDAFVAFPSCTGAPTAAITPSGVDSICPGDSVTLTATTATGYTFKWSTGATTQSITVHTSGSYTVKVFLAGDSATSAPTTVAIRPTGVDSITDSGSGSNQTLTVSGNTGTYAWYNGSNVISGATGSTYHPTTNGTYSVWVTTNCGVVVSNSIVVTHVGINEVSSNIALRLYPNPSEGIFTLDAPNCIGSYYEITDELGRTIQKKLIQTENSIVDVSSQLSGVYFLTVQVGQQNQTIRFLIRK